LNITVWAARVSSSGTAVEFPSAEAEATGVTGRDPLVGDGSCEGTEGEVGTVMAALQAFKTNIREEVDHKAKERFFMGTPEGEMISPRFNITLTNETFTILLN
jgi:hypothetical protein